MPAPRTCPICGTPLPSGVAEGQCPSCLLTLAGPTVAEAPGAGPSAAATKPAGGVLPRGTEQPGDKIGQYKLLQPIGEGGMGSVWMAEQQQPYRRVALKVLKLGM